MLIFCLKGELILSGWNRVKGSNDHQGKGKFKRGQNYKPLALASK